MGRNRWTTPSQFQWLTDRIPLYLQSKDGDVRAFHASTYKSFTEKWPVVPTDAEVVAAKGDADKAKQVKEAALKKVSRPRCSR